MAGENMVAYGPHPHPDFRHPSISAYVDIVMESHNFTPLVEATVNALNCTDMRELLARRGLKMTGSKAALRDRLLTSEPDVAKVRNNVMRKVMSRVLNHIREYGEDGMGDKPAHMDTVVYWLAHFDPESFQ